MPFPLNVRDKNKKETSYEEGDSFLFITEIISNFKHRLLFFLKFCLLEVGFLQFV